MGWQVTAEELLALPEMVTEFGSRTEYREGIGNVTVPVAPPSMAMYQAPDDGMFELPDGTAWLTGWVDGVRMRRRCSS